jgi:hypothetical protein
MTPVRRAATPAAPASSPPARPCRPGSRVVYSDVRVCGARPVREEAGA